jgi:hypothetical protein
MDTCLAVVTDGLKNAKEQLRPTQTTDRNSPTVGRFQDTVIRNMCARCLARQSVTKRLHPRSVVVPSRNPRIFLSLQNPVQLPTCCHTEMVLSLRLIIVVPHDDERDLSGVIRNSWRWPSDQGLDVNHEYDVIIRYGQT